MRVNKVDLSHHSYMNPHFNRIWWWTEARLQHDEGEAFVKSLLSSWNSLCKWQRSYVFFWGRATGILSLFHLVTWKPLSAPSSKRGWSLCRQWVVYQSFKKMITWLCLKSNYLHIMCDIDLKVIILYLTVVARDAELVECLDKCQKKGHSGSKCQKRCYPTVLDQQIKAVIHTNICDDPKIYSRRFWRFFLHSFLGI